MAGDERRVEPLQCNHAGPPDVAGGDADAVDPGGRLRDQLDGGVLAVGRLGERAGVAEHLADGVGVERDDHRLTVELFGDRSHIVVGDGAHRAQRPG